MKLRNWKNRPCPATTAARTRTGAILPCRRWLSPVPDLSWLLLPDETLVVFLPKLFDVPGCPAPQQKRADGNQQKQRHADDQGRLFHRIGSSQSCAFFSIGFVRPGSGTGRVQEWGGDGLVTAFCQQPVVFRGRAVHAPARSLS